MPIQDNSCPAASQLNVVMKSEVGQFHALSWMPGGRGTESLRSKRTRGG
jgi:hypothetical protein